MNQDRRHIKQTGSGRRSLALGDADPRPRRGGEAQGSPQAFAEGLEIDNRGRLKVALGPGLVFRNGRIELDGVLPSSSALASTAIGSGGVGLPGVDGTDGRMWLFGGGPSGAMAIHGGTPATTVYALFIHGGGP
jgi:hypothetical protein